ncbi:hypothetical protein D3C81_1646780 [compost metagenome]
MSTSAFGVPFSVRPTELPSGGAAGAKFSAVSTVAVVFCSVMTVFQPAPPLAVPFWSHCSSASAPCCTRRK